jgi:hypothetical protein
MLRRIFPTRSIKEHLRRRGVTTRGRALIGWLLSEVTLLRQGQRGSSLGMIECKPSIWAERGAWLFRNGS